jgi:hypothetical protein
MRLNVILSVRSEYECFVISQKYRYNTLEYIRKEMFVIKFVGMDASALMVFIDCGR